MFSSRLSKLYAVLVFLLPVIGVTVHSMTGYNYFLTWQLPSICFVSSVLLWTVRIKKTILEVSIRKMLLFQTALIFFWYIVRMCRFSLFRYSGILDGFFWYCYYIPIIFIGITGFFIAAFVGKDEEQSRAILKKYSFIFVIGTLLVCLVLTNDHHELVFDLSENDPYHTYEYNMVYYFIVIFTVIMNLLTFVLCTKKSIGSIPKKQIWGVPVIYFFFVLYLILYNILPEFAAAFPLKFPEMYIFFMMLIFEYYMQTGLIPVNTGYDDFVKNSSLSVKIENRSGEAFLVSKGFEETEAGMSEKDIVLHSVQSGNRIVSWLTDVRDINALADKLNEINRELSVENEITEQKLELARRKKAIEQQSLLYDKMYFETQAQITKINDILEKIDPEADDFNKKLLRVCVLGAYVKRRSNLILISGKNNRIRTEELAFCFRETLEYLDLCGIVSSFYLNAAGEMNGDTAGEMYDFFEKTVEALYDKAEAVMLTLERRNGVLTLCMEISAREELTAPQNDGTYLHTAYEASDGTLYITVTEKGALYET